MKQQAAMNKYQVAYYVEVFHPQSNGINVYLLKNKKTAIDQTGGVKASPKSKAPKEQGCEHQPVAFIQGFKVPYFWMLLYTLLFKKLYWSKNSLFLWLSASYST